MLVGCWCCVVLEVRLVLVLDRGCSGYVGCLVFGCSCFSVVVLVLGVWCWWCG